MGANDKVAATFHGVAPTFHGVAPTFVSVCGLGEPSEVTPSAAAGLVRLGWTPPVIPHQNSETTEGESA